MTQFCYFVSYNFAILYHTILLFCIIHLVQKKDKKEADADREKPGMVSLTAQQKARAKAAKFMNPKMSPGQFFEAFQHARHDRCSELGCECGVKRYFRQVQKNRATNTEKTKATKAAQADAAARAEAEAVAAAAAVAQAAADAAAEKVEEERLRKMKHLREMERLREMMTPFLRDDDTVCKEEADRFVKEASPGAAEMMKQTLENMHARNLNAEECEAMQQRQFILKAIHTFEEKFPTLLVLMSPFLRDDKDQLEAARFVEEASPDAASYMAKLLGHLHNMGVHLNEGKVNELKQKGEMLMTIQMVEEKFPN